MDTYILCREYRKNQTLIMEYVLQYGKEDMTEVFNDAERNELGSGRIVERDAKHGAGKITFVNMVIAARATERAGRVAA